MTGKKTRVILRYTRGARARLATWLRANALMVGGEAPRLNTQQALELAFLVVEMLRRT